MGLPSYYGSLAKMTLPELQAELETELQALRELNESDPYDDLGRQINATRENIEVIKREIGNKARAQAAPQPAAVTAPGPVVSCVHCGTVLSWEIARAGQVASCPSCRKQFRLPSSC